MCQMSDFMSTYSILNNLLECNDFESVNMKIEHSSLYDEPCRIKIIPNLLIKLTDPKTSTQALETGNLIIKKMNVFAIEIYMKILYDHFDSMKWQIKKGALILLGLFADHQKHVVQHFLPNMILKLIDMASDIKQDVKTQTRLCFEQLCSIIDNVDIIKIIPCVIDAYMEPVKYTENALDTLVATSFINEVDMQTLGLLVPILTKGMREKKVASKRRAALVIGNMCKLVNDPRTASYFYPILKPVLERGIDEIAVEEVRKVCQNSLDTLLRVSNEAAQISESVMKQPELLECVKKFTSNENVNVEEDHLIHISKCCEGLVLSNNRKHEDWYKCIFPYINGDEETIKKIIEQVHIEGIANLTPDKVDPEDEEEDLCNAQFSLAYGTRVLLHQTPFRVKIGRQ